MSIENPDFTEPKPAMNQETLTGKDLNEQYAYFIAVDRRDLDGYTSVLKSCNEDVSIFKYEHCEGASDEYMNKTAMIAIKNGIVAHNLEKKLIVQSHSGKDSEGGFWGGCKIKDGDKLKEIFSSRKIEKPDEEKNLGNDEFYALALRSPYGGKFGSTENQSLFDDIGVKSERDKIIAEKLFYDDEGNPLSREQTYKTADILQKMKYDDPDNSVDIATIPKAEDVIEKVRESI